MDETLRFLVHHGYLVLFALVFVEQIGVPLPAIPILLGAGALAAMGRFSAGGALALAAVASVGADAIWYGLGRARGSRVLHLLCRISLEPDSCVRVTSDAFARWGGRSLLIAKFVPGLNTIAPPMAGITAMSAPRFLALDTAGSLLYVGTFMLIGWIWSDQLEAIVEHILAAGRTAPFVIGLLLASWVLFKYVRRRLFLRELRIARISPEELKLRMDSGEEIVVVDLRHSADAGESGRSIPGAIRIAIDAIEQGHDRIPRDREIVLFCT